MKSRGENADYKLNIRGAKPMLRIAIGCDEPIFGPGPAQLFELIEQTASVRAACAEMKMSYSKGFKIIRRVDRALGTAAVKCRQGGEYGGGASLTNAGRMLLSSYREYELRVKESAVELFYEYFGEADLCEE